MDNIIFCMCGVAILTGTDLLHYSTTVLQLLLGLVPMLLGLGIAAYIIFTEGNRNG